MLVIQPLFSKDHSSEGKKKIGKQSGIQRRATKSVRNHKTRPVLFLPNLRSGYDIVHTDSCGKVSEVTSRQMTKTKRGIKHAVGIT